MIYIGIDPGVSGGIASLNNMGNVIEVHRMPDTPADLLQLLRIVGYTKGDEERRAMLEQVNAGVFGQGKAGRMGVSSAFTFGRGVGWIQMALLAANIRTDQVQPARWQTALGCRTHGDKNISKARAQQLWPGRKITHAIADALLIAEYGRRLHRGHLAATNNGGRNGEEESGKEGQGRKGQSGQAGPRRGETAAHTKGRPAVPDAPRHGASADRSAR